MEDISTEDILAEVEAGASGEAPQTEQISPDQAPSPAEYEYQIEGGKTIKEPLEMILKRAGLGYHYAQRAQALNETEKRYKELETANGQLSRWQEFHDYAQNNPDWWRHVEDSWNNRGQVSPREDLNGEVNPLVEALQQKVEELSKFKDEWQSERTQLQHAEQDKALESEVEAVGQEFGVDLWQADEQGQSLQWRVLEHMESLGLDGSKPGHFKAAFKDFYFDNLVTKNRESAMEQHAKDEAERKKAGILDVSRTPAAQPSHNPLNGKLSDSQITERIMAELREQGIN